MVQVTEKNNLYKQYREEYEAARKVKPSLVSLLQNVPNVYGLSTMRLTFQIKPATDMLN